MKQITELRKQFQEVQEGKERQKSKIKRSILRSEQRKIADKINQLIKNQKDIDSDIVDLVNDDFWNLI